MKNINEEILTSWLCLSKAISNEKLVEDMTYNESIICNTLYHSQLKEPHKELTATDLCRETRMLKSLMNRTLNNMENKKLILRKRSDTDKRRISVRLNPEQLTIYEQQHTKILNLIDAIVQRIGEKRAYEAIDLFHTIADIAEEVIQ